MERVRSQSSDDRELAIKVLSWISCAIRPLTLEEVQHALAVRPGDDHLDKDGFPDEERLLSVCAGIVTIQRKSKTIILVHYTAQEYFKNKSDKHFPQAQGDITGAALDNQATQQTCSHQLASCAWSQLVNPRYLSQCNLSQSRCLCDFITSNST